MIIKTTINIKSSQVMKLKSISAKLNISMSSIINNLVKMTFKVHEYKNQIFTSIKYQNKIIDSIDVWKCQPVSFTVDVYEKCLDLKKLYKLSCSRIIAESIDKYLDNLTFKIKEENTSDNNNSNYIVFHSRSGNFNYITQLWDMIDEKKLKIIQKMHLNL